MKQKKDSKKQSKDQVVINDVQGEVQIAQTILIEEFDGNSVLNKQNQINCYQINLNLILAYFKDLTLNELVTENQVISYTLCGKKNNFKVINIQPKLEQCDKWLITKETKFELQEKTNNNQYDLCINKQKLYGIDKYILRFEQLIQESIGQEMDKLIDLGFYSIKGILLIGQSGVGKTVILKHLQQKLRDQYDISYISLSAENKTYSLQDILIQTKGRPKIILLDDLQSNKVSFLNDDQVVKSLCTFFDTISIQDKITIIASVKNIKDINEYLRRSGRFEKEIFVELPNFQDRYAIISQISKDVNIKMTPDEIKEISYQMSGFTINDIRSVFREMIIRNNQTPFSNIMKEINPSGLKDLLTDIPSVLWQDIGGYQDVKEEVRKVIEWPLKYSDSFKRLGVNPSKGILLYGPPGCCKTLIARAIATECTLNFMAVKGPELFSKYVGDSEKAIRDIFKKARLCAPSVIFFDEIDAIAPQRSGSTDVADRVLIQLLTEMDGFQELKNVIVVGATNRPDSIDKALLRPGRFDHLIYVDIPDSDSRKEIFQVNIRKMKISHNIQEQLPTLVQNTNGYTGAEICQICKEAGLFALARNIDAEDIEMQDFQKALQKVKPRITSLILQSFRNFQENAKFNI